jgi:5-amino-6-(5-phosphoribosylamino)uracil reductase
MLWRTRRAIGSFHGGGTIGSMPVNRVDRLWPSPAFDLDLGDAMAGFEPPAARDGRPSVAVNMVTSVDGRAQLAGTAEGLGSRTDRALMRLYRASFDAVLSGAGTLRQTDVWLRVGDDLAARRLAEGRSPQPIGVVVAGHDPVPTDAKWFDGDERRILFVGSENPMTDAPNGTELVRAPDPRPTAGWILGELAARGVSSVLVEGGPRFNAALAAERLIDELYWTIGPHLIGSDALPMVAAFAEDDAEPWRGQLTSVMRHEDELLLRYRFGDPLGSGR